MSKMQVSPFIEYIGIIRENGAFSKMTVNPIILKSSKIAISHNQLRDNNMFKIDHATINITIVIKYDLAILLLMCSFLSILEHVG